MISINRLPAKFIFQAVIISFLIFTGIKDVYPGNGIEMRYSYGFLVRHHLDMGIYTKAHFPAFEISYTMPVSGLKKWHHDHHFPYQGISFFYSSLGKSEILGNVAAVVPWMRLPIYQADRSGFWCRIGAGIGYFNKKFDVKENYKNLAIGSHLNACIALGAEFRVHVGNRITIFSGLGWTHFSNGTMVAPNYGINIPNLNLGFCYGISNKKNNKKEVKDSVNHRLKGLCLGVSHGIKQVLPLEGPYYQVISMSVSYIRPVKRNGSHSLSLDLFNDQSDKPLLKREGIDANGSFDLVKLGISAGIGTQFGRTSVSFSLGTYLSGKEKSDGTVYDKLGIDVKLNERIAVMLYLKTHYAKADFIGWGLMFNLLNK